jgi:hypothetical protein
MNFLYPKFDKPTHKIKFSRNISSEYPVSDNFTQRRDLPIPADALVAVVQENIGYNCEWSEVKLIDQNYASQTFFNQNFYILNENLTSVNNKKTFSPFCQIENRINPNAEEIDPTIKETFIPYIDQKNGFYSVRIQTDYEKILDLFLFETLLQEVLYEGVNVLLASRGYRSDNATIEKLLNEYNTFAYINKDLDLTVTRPCEPLTFTVSIPLRFFNNLEQQSEPRQTRTTSEFQVRFTNKNFIETINRILKILSSRASDIILLTYPNKFIQNFSLDYELLRLKKFPVTAANLFSLAGYPLNSPELIQYEIGFNIDRSENTDLAYIKITTPNEEKYLPQNVLSQFRLSGEFNSGRIFNYFIEVSNMQSAIRTTDMLDFIKTYVKYPNPTLTEAKISVGNEEIEPERLRSFRKNLEDSEACINLSDIINPARSAVNFYDTTYFLFVEQEKGQTKVKTGLEKIRENDPFIRDLFKNKQPEPDSREKFTEESISLQVKKDFDESVDTLKSKYSLSLSTLTYVCGRLNLTKVFFQHIFCYLRGLRSSNSEIQDLVALIENKPEIFNYFLYLYNSRKYRGSVFQEAVKNVNFDLKLLCTSNQELIYFVKALAAISKSLNIIGPQLVVFKNSLKNKRSTNPYTQLTTAIITNIERVVTDIVFQSIRDSLAISCEDDLLDDPVNFVDPFTTHEPIQGFQKEENSNPSNVRRNVDKSLQELFTTEVVNQLQFGFDREYVVNLLEKLFKDINCILTPIESVQLLRGTPTDISIVLIKNLIRNKYNENPNNLLFLIEDETKLKLFFQKFGQTVDPVVLENIERTIGDPNKYIGTKLCKDEFADTRQKIIENKLPPDLGVLADQISNRAKKARKLFEYVTNGPIELDISSLCPDQDDTGLLSQVKDNIISSYNDFIENLFSDVLVTFNSNVKSLSNIFLEKKQYIQQTQENPEDPTSRIFLDTNPENIYYSVLPTFSYNLEGYVRVLYPEALNYSDIYQKPFIPLKEANFGMIYIPDEQETQISNLASNFIKREESDDSFVFCPPNELILSDSFKKFLSRTNFYTELVFEDYFFDESGVTQGDLDESREENSGIAKELKEKPYFISITLDYEGLIASDPDFIVEFKLYNNNVYDNKYEVVLVKKFEGSIEGDSSIKNSKDLALVILQVLSKQQNKRISDLDDIYSLKFTKDFIVDYDSADNVLTKFLNDLYNLYFKEKIEQELERLLAVQDLITKFKKYGLFQNHLNFDDREKILVNKILVSTTTETGDIALKEYISTKTKLKDDIYKQINDTLLGSNIAQNNLYKVENAPVFNPADYQNLFVNNRETHFAFINYDFLDFIRESLIQKVLISSPNTSQALESYKQKEYANKLIGNISKLNIFDMSQDIRYKNCNIFPHYLNLDFFKQRALDTTKQTLCDDNLEEAPDNIIKEIIVNMTFRTHVTDLLIKCFQILNLLNKQTLEKFHKNEFIVNTIYQFMKRELEVYGTRQNNTTIYFKAFKKITEENYDLYLKNGSLNGINDNITISLKKDFLNDDFCNDEEYKFKYFIRKEIRHFIYYAISTRILQPAENNIWDDYITNKKSNRISVKNLSDAFNFVSTVEKTFSQNIFDEIDTENPVLLTSFVRTEDVTNYVPPAASERVWYNSYRSTELVSVAYEANILVNNKYTKTFLEYYVYYLISHEIMANTIDFNKKTILASTKSELANLLFQTLPNVLEETGESQVENTRKQEDIVKFVKNLAYSPNPSVMSALYPDYSKYVEFYKRAALTTARTVLLTVASNSDKNILLTRFINTLSATIGSIGWSLTPPETRRKLIATSSEPAALFLYKRLEDGKSLFPDALISGLLAIKVPYDQLLLSLSYLTIDTISEVVYYIDSLEEIKKLREEYTEEGQPLDPCEQTQEAVNQGTLEQCTPESQERLKKLVNAYEELPKTENEIVTTGEQC